jgi:hypothetical protein
MTKWTHELNRAFSKEEVQLAEKTHEEMLNIPGCKEMQIKTMLRFLFTPVRMAVIKNTNNKCWQGFRGKGTFIHCWWECKLVQPL